MPLLSEHARGRKLTASDRQSAQRGSRAAERVVLVVACAQRKRTGAPNELRLSTINGAVANRLPEWQRRLGTVNAPLLPAQSLYTGDHWHAVLEAFSAVQRYTPRVELWVISAGYGLIPGNQMIKPYSATFAGGDTDSVWRGPTDGPRRARLKEWWRGLANEVALPDLVTSRSTVVIAAGANYVDAMEDDIAIAVGKGKERVSVISAGSRDLPGLLPLTSSFRAYVGGTDSATNARVLALLAAESATHRFLRHEMAKRLNTIAAKLDPVPRTIGRKVTDREIAREIRAFRRRDPHPSRTAALRELRRRGIACEQSRFAHLWLVT
jgi:hypothetical protein